MFIVLYGINNLGKSTQAKKLVDRFLAEGKKAVYLKYPIYDLDPSGIMLNAYLREGNPYKLTAREAQTLYTLNRAQYEKQLETLLDSGTIVIAEDYTGTGIAWGMGAGVKKDYLLQINSALKKEDLAFWFDGERFLEAKEQKHKHESDDSLMSTVRGAHEELAQDFGWIHINANQSIEETHQQLWNTIAQNM